MITVPLPEELTTVSLPSRGVNLEARIYHGVPGGVAHDYGVIISHPYGPLGGDLYNNVVREVTTSLGHLGVPTLRYNMRGVGKSSGRTSWTADPEAQDIAALVEWWTTHDSNQPWAAPDGTLFPRSKPQRILIIGYSFGALISLPVARTHTSIAGLVLISPPSRVSWALTVFRSSKFTQSLPPSLPKLAIFGSSDQISSESSMLTFIGKVFGVTSGIPLDSNLIDNGRETTQSGTIKTVKGQVVIVRDRDHFWVGEEDGIVDVIEHWVRTTFGWDSTHGPGRNDPNISSRAPLVSSTPASSEGSH